ncbi:hypothetical protein GCM10010402_67890 [Actinomadura luteofluorescens]
MLVAVAHDGGADAGDDGARDDEDGADDSAADEGGAVGDHEFRHWMTPGLWHAQVRATRSGIYRPKTRGSRIHDSGHVPMSKFDRRQK